MEPSGISWEDSVKGCSKRRSVILSKSFGTVGEHICFPLQAEQTRRHAVSTDKCPRCVVLSSTMAQTDGVWTLVVWGGGRRGTGGP